MKKFFNDFEVKFLIQISPFLVAGASHIWSCGFVFNWIYVAPAWLVCIYISTYVDCVINGFPKLYYHPDFCGPDPKKDNSFLRRDNFGSIHSDQSPGCSRNSSSGFSFGDGFSSDSFSSGSSFNSSTGLPMVGSVDTSNHFYGS